MDKPFELTPILIVIHKIPHYEEDYSQGRGERICRSWLA